MSLTRFCLAGAHPSFVETIMLLLPRM
jgi:hypothetical protein